MIRNYHIYRSVLAGFIVSIVLLTTGCNSTTSETTGTTTTTATSEAEAMLAQAQTIHQSALTIDAHADTEIPGKPSAYVGKDGLSQIEPVKMRAGGLDAVVMSVAVGPMPRTAAGYVAARSIADEKLAAVNALAADAANNSVIPRTADELVAAHSAGQSSLLLGFQNALILGTDVTAINDFYDAGVRLFALTHMGHNDFADSSRPLFVAETGKHEVAAEHGGLSDLGVAAIRRLNALGAIVDISQLSKQAALQAIALSNSPVVASHSNVHALTNATRNLSDQEIDAIGATGGVIHVAPFRGYLFDSSDPTLDADIRAIRRTAGIEEDYLYPFELYWEIDDTEVKTTFLAGISELLVSISLDDMINHLDYIAKRIGVDHVGIGTDFNHGSGIPGYEDASDAFNVTLELVKRGYSKKDIEKIWGGNFIRVWRAAENAAQ